MTAPNDDAELSKLSREIALALRSLWKERMDVVFGPARKTLEAAHEKRSQALSAQIRTLGEELKRRGGIALMHALVRKLNTEDARCKDAVEQIWMATPGYAKWRRLP